MLASFFYTKIHIYYLFFFSLFVCFIYYVDSIDELLLFRKKQWNGDAFKFNLSFFLITPSLCFSSKLINFNP